MRSIHLIRYKYTFILIVVDYGFEIGSRLSIKAHFILVDNICIGGHQQEKAQLHKRLFLVNNTAR